VGVLSVDQRLAFVSRGLGDGDGIGIPGVITCGGLGDGVGDGVFLLSCP